VKNAMFDCQVVCGDRDRTRSLEWSLSSSSAIQWKWYYKYWKRIL